VKHVSTTESTGFAGGIGLSLGRVAEPHQRRAQVSELERPPANSIEMKIWAVLFALIILATITLIVVILTEEPTPAHAALWHRSSVASSPVLFFS